LLDWGQDETLGSQLVMPLAGYYHVGAEDPASC
jgi:hypothetical protein